MVSEQQGWDNMGANMGLWTLDGPRSPDEHTYICEGGLWPCQGWKLSGNRNGGPLGRIGSGLMQWRCLRVCVSVCVRLRSWVFAESVLGGVWEFLEFLGSSQGTYVMPFLNAS